MTHTKKTLNTGEQENGFINAELEDTSINGILLTKKRNNVVVSSRILAKGVGVQHQATTKLATKHQSEVEKHGSWSGFIIQPSGQKKEAFFNEEQAAFILMLLRNTPTVVSFKSALVSAFYKLRRKHERLMDRHARLEYQQNRLIGKYHRRDMTDIIKPFVDYSTHQGSKGARFLYSNITKWTNKTCGTKSIETADELQLSHHSTVCDIVTNTIHQGIANNANYTDIKTEIKSKLGSFSNLLGIKVGK